MRWKGLNHPVFWLRLRLSVSYFLHFLRNGVVRLGGNFAVFLCMQKKKPLQQLKTVYSAWLRSYRNPLK